MSEGLLRYAPNEKKSTAGAAATVGNTSLAFPFAIEGGRNRPFEVDFSSLCDAAAEALETPAKLSAGPPPPPRTRLDSGAAGVAFLGAGSAENSDDEPAPFVPPDTAAVRGFFGALSSSSSSNFGASTVMRTGPSRRFLGAGSARDDDGIVSVALGAEFAALGRALVPLFVGGEGGELVSPSLSLSDP